MTAFSSGSLRLYICVKALSVGCTLRTQMVRIGFPSRVLFPDGLRSVAQATVSNQQFLQSRPEAGSRPLEAGMGRRSEWSSP